MHKNTKLLPLLLVYPSEKFNNQVFRDEVSQKISGVEEGITGAKEQTDDLIKKVRIGSNSFITNEEEKTSLPYYKKIDIADVEKNAEKMKWEGKNIMTEEKSKFQEKVEENKKPQSTIQDTYREQIE